MRLYVLVLRFLCDFVAATFFHLDYASLQVTFGIVAGWLLAHSFKQRPNNTFLNTRANYNVNKL